MCDRPEVDLSARVDAWKQVIQTQMHFNDLSVRSRQLGLTFVVAALGLSVVMVTQFPESGLTLFGKLIHVSAFLTAASAFAVLAVRTLDLGVYHRMLRGSVAFQEAADMRGLAKEIFNMPCGMTEYISAYSRSENAKYNENGEVIIGKIRNAAMKVSVFYNYVFIFLGLFTVIIALFVNVPVDQAVSDTP